MLLLLLLQMNPPCANTSLAVTSTAPWKAQQRDNVLYLIRPPNVCRPTAHKEREFPKVCCQAHGEARSLLLAGSSSSSSACRIEMESWAITSWHRRVCLYSESSNITRLPWKTCSVEDEEAYDRRVVLQVALCILKALRTKP